MTSPSRSRYCVPEKLMLKSTEALQQKTSLNGFSNLILSEKRVMPPKNYISAFLLLQLMIGKFDYVEMNFSDIPIAVKNGKVDAGLVIHETQLSYSQEGIIKVLDTGEWWNEITNGLPVPLGINVMKNSFGLETIRKFDGFLQESIEFGLKHTDDAIKYAMKYGREKPRD